MFTLKIKELLLLRGFKPSYYELQKMGLPHTAAKAYYYNKAKSIRLDYLYLLCERLQCTPAEILQVSMPEGFIWDESMPLYAWRAQPVVNPFDKMKTLTPEQLKALNAFLGEV
jgi:DNA-binding Xre family transcriptional regulator